MQHQPRARMKCAHGQDGNLLQDGHPNPELGPKSFPTPLISLSRYRLADHNQGKNQENFQAIAGKKHNINYCVRNSMMFLLNL